jgi:hypothetical protein
MFDMLWRILSFFWLGISIASLLGVWGDPQLRLRYASKTDMSSRVALTLVTIILVYVRTLDAISVWILLISLPIILTTWYLGYRHRKLVMNIH